MHLGTIYWQAASIFELHEGAAQDSKWLKTQLILIYKAGMKH